MRIQQNKYLMRAKFLTKSDLEGKEDIKCTFYGLSFKQKKLHFWQI